MCFTIAAVKLLEHFLPTFFVNTITKIQNGKFFFTETVFDFSELVLEVINDMQITNHSHEIACSSCNSITVFGDRDKVGQVLNNLISNAIKYSPKADKIIVNTHVEGEGVQVSVQDFGIGISTEHQKNIFDQFYRVTGKNQSTFSGMGIGLYIASEIVKKQGGKIWIDSVVGEGSVFYIWLPFDHRTINTSNDM
jgi:signal transduction histidine kinase